MNSWLVSEEEFLQKSPSRKQLTLTQELKLRESIYEFVIRLGRHLKVSGVTMLAATIYINRFYMRYPITTSKYFVACAALAISSKLNDTYRPPDTIAMAACSMKNPHKQIDEHSDVFWQWRDQLLYREELILKGLNFELNIDLPYQLRDHLLALSLSEEEAALPFYQRHGDVVRNVVSAIELLSSLPVAVVYDMNTFFGAMVVLTVKEARTKFPDENIVVPANYLSEHIGTSTESTFLCYKFLLRLLKHCQSSDAKLVSHKAAAQKVIPITRSEFFQIAGSPNPKKEDPSVESKGTPHATLTPSDTPKSVAETPNGLE